MLISIVIQSCYAFTTCNNPPPTPSPLGSTESSTLGDQDGLESSAITPPAAASIVNVTTDTTTNATLSKPTSNTTSLTGSQAGGSDCTGKPCEIAGECRSQFGFCGSSFIYCNDLSSWTIDNCGLFGVDENGEKILCEADVQDCPGGERMIRNPDSNCEFFSCPAEEVDAGLTGLYVPASTPTLPELVRVNDVLLFNTSPLHKSHEYCYNTAEANPSHNNKSQKASTIRFCRSHLRIKT